jgi:Zn-dependent protease
MDFFNQGIPLGRWFKITVIIHWTFLLYAANELIINRSAAPFWMDALYLGLLFGTVLTHEFGHALSCKAVGGEAHQIILWPLGGIAFVNPPMNPMAWLITTACGPLVNAVLWPVFWFASSHWALPYLETLEDPLGIRALPAWACVYMYSINRGLLLFNLIPAYPMDGGRLLQEILWFIIGYPRSLQIAGMVGTVAGIGFVVLGLGIQGIDIPWINFELGNNQHKVEPILVVIGILCALQSFAIYRRSQEIKTWRKN